MSALKSPITMVRPTATAERRRVIRATPDQIFALLADPQHLARLMPRVERVEVLQRRPNSASVRTSMALGPLGNLSTEGEVAWIEGRELLFSAQRPVGVETRWKLLPDPAGTLLTASMAIDLAPMLGPLAAFIPAESVAAMLGPDLEAALAAIARQAEH
jgi:carbon monoxide dehydrogenase subunit G